MVASLFPLSVKDALVKRQGKRLVGPVSLDMKDLGMTVVMGPNGAGKTTFLKMVHGLERLSSGSVSWACPSAEARRLQAFVFQTPILLRRSVVENVAYPLQLKGIPRKEALREAAQRLDDIGLSSLANQAANRLSGGEKQKLAIARALITDPKLLILDEPCASLDGRSMREIEAILKDTRNKGTRILISTHNIGQAKRLADEVLFVAGGEICEYSSANTFFENPQSQQAQAYLRGDIVE